MADYPLSTVPGQTTAKPRNARLTVDASDAGTVRIADTGANDLYDVNVQHQYLSATERAAFWTFFDANRLTSCTLTVDNSPQDVYTLVFSEVPTETKLSATRWNITANLVGTKA